MRQNPYLEVEGDRMSESTSEDEEAKQEETRRAIGMKPSENGARENNQVEEEEPRREIQWPPECKTSTEGAKGEQNVVFENVNITNMAYNAKAVIERDADAIFFQEHKMKGNVQAEMREKFKEAGWVMQGGPCDETTKKPNAGVGVAAREASKIVVVQGERNTKSFQHAWLAGRAEKSSDGRPM